MQFKDINLKIAIIKVLNKINENNWPEKQNQLEILKLKKCNN